MRCVDTLTSNWNGSLISLGHWDATVPANRVLTGINMLGSAVIGRWDADPANRVLSNLVVYGTAQPISGFILPKVVPTAPVNGQMWLDLSVVVP
jgi:hypothetical protein